MIGNRNAAAWKLACGLFERGRSVIESALSESEKNAVALLVDLKAAKPKAIDASYLLCPYCQLHRGAVVQGRSGIECHCPDCGSVSIDKPDTRAWLLDTDWLIRKLRGALDIPGQPTPLAVTADVWRLGLHQRHTIILARSLQCALTQPSILPRAEARSTGLPWILTPKPFRDVFHDPFDGHAVWLPLEERFSLYGGNLHFIEPGMPFLSNDGGTIAVHGPFSADFRTVYLEGWVHGPILLSEAQAAVFKALWHFNGMPQTAERIMNKAGLGSSKPIDVFKVKTQNKGDPKYEGPLYAYKTLIDSDRRSGTYAMYRTNTGTA